jgi:hypothetical protein
LPAACRSSGFDKQADGDLLIQDDNSVVIELRLTHFGAVGLIVPGVDFCVALEV